MCKENQIEPIMTIHAKVRWSQRCATLSLEEEFASSKLAGGKVKKKIMASCPKHMLSMIRGTADVSYLISPSKVVFVCNSVGVVITVFTLH